MDNVWIEYRYDIHRLSWNYPYPHSTGAPIWYLQHGASNVRARAHAPTCMLVNAPFTLWQIGQLGNHKVFLESSCKFSNLRTNGCVKHYRILPRKWVHYTVICQSATQNHRKKTHFHAIYNYLRMRSL